MTEQEIETLLQQEGVRRRAALADVYALAESHREGLGRRCASHRRTRSAVRLAAACCVLAGAVLGANTAIAAPQLPAVAGTHGVQHAMDIVDTLLVEL